MVHRSFPIGSSSIFSDYFYYSRYYCLLLLRYYSKLSILLLWWLPSLLIMPSTQPGKGRASEGVYQPIEIFCLHNTTVHSNQLLGGAIRNSTGNFPPSLSVLVGSQFFLISIKPSFLMLLVLLLTDLLNQGSLFQYFSDIRTSLAPPRKQSTQECKQGLWHVSVSGEDFFNLMFFGFSLVAKE